MPAEAVARSFSACLTRVMVAGGTSVVVVVEVGVVELGGTLEAVAWAAANAAWASASSLVALATSAWAVVTEPAAADTDSRGEVRSAPAVLTSPTVALVSVNTLP